jgi:hypothetical protein
VHRTKVAITDMFCSHWALLVAELTEKKYALCLVFQVNEFLNCLIDARNELLQRCVVFAMNLTSVIHCSECFADPH